MKFRTPSLSATVYKPNLGAPNSLQTVYGVLSVRSVGRRACDMLLVDSTREVCNPSTATRLYGGHTETTACDRRTEHFPWVLLTGQQPGVLAGVGVPTLGCNAPGGSKRCKKKRRRTNKSKPVTTSPGRQHNFLVLRHPHPAILNFRFPLYPILQC